MKREKQMETRKIVSMPTELIKRIADYRHEERVSTEAEAIRVLIDLGLRSVGK